MTASFAVLALTACDSVADREGSTANATPALQATERPAQAEKPAIPTPALPDHNYDEKNGWDYHYVAALSEEDRQRGQAAEDVVTFQYLGVNENGRHVLASMNPDGTVWRTASCSPQCRIIEYDDGRRVAYSTRSIIGAAFQDAFRGKLRVADWAKDKFAGPEPSRPTGESGRTIMPDVSSAVTPPVSDEPWEAETPIAEAPQEPGT